MDFTDAAKAISIPTVFMLAGYYGAMSQNPLPILLDQPASVSTQIFKQVYNRGITVVAPGAAIATAGFTYLAYIKRHHAHTRNMYGAAAMLTFGVLPWTRFAMWEGIHRLIEISESSIAVKDKAGVSGEVGKLLNGWIRANWVRAGLQLGAGIVGVMASL